MLDSLLELLIHGAGRVLGYIIIEILFDIVFYCIGVLFIKIITFGRYPKLREKRSLQVDEKHKKSFPISLTGVVISIAVVVLYFF